MTPRPRLAVAVLGAALLTTTVVGCASDEGTTAPTTTSTMTATTATTATTFTTDASPTTGADPSSAQPEGFSTVTVRITDANGEVCEVCMWLADSADERGRGLMGVTDLGDAAGMAFVFERVGQGAFYMFRTVTPLSIAWFGPDGTFVSSTDMAPCESDDPGECERYAPGGGYDLAIEVFDGGLAPLGIGVGSRVELLAGTEAARCDTPAS